jgi:N-acetyltransferase 10
VPLYIRQTTSELTGEHSCVMVRGLNSSTSEELEWLAEFAKGTLPTALFARYVLNCMLDFRRRFMSLLSFGFREFGSVTALSIVEAANVGAKAVDDNNTRGQSSAFDLIHPLNCAQSLGPGSSPSS